MERIKLMVVDDNREFCRLVKDYAEMINEVEFCGAAFDGISSLELIRERKPDVILLDNVMPQLDGIGVMKHLQNFEKSIKPKVVAITASPTNAYVTEISRLGADYIVSRNMDIDDMINRCILVVKSPDKAEVPQYENLESLVTSAICTLGVPAHVNGYGYMRTSIGKVITKPDLMRSVTKVLYPEVARIHKTTPSKVERNIRNAIEIAWNRGDKQAFERMFGTTLDFSKPKPTNSEFIAMVADKLRLAMKNNKRNVH